MEAKKRQNGFNVATYRVVMHFLFRWIQLLPAPEIFIEVTSRAAYLLQDVSAWEFIVNIGHLTLITLRQE